MYSATTTPGEPGVTLQLRDPNELEEKGELSSVLARIQRESGTLNICYQNADIDSGIDVLVGSTTPLSRSSEKDRNSEDLIKLSVKKQRYKANSPNRQGPQQCQTCGKVFGNASALAKHKLTHSDERKYACTMCGKAFKRQDHLNGHMLTHRNKKPYECRADGCGKSYCDARSLRRHTENHHNGLQIPSSTTSSSPCTPKEEESTQTCIHYAPPPSNDESTPPSTNSKTNSTQVSQLQKLLASESLPKSSETGGGGSNDGLAKQQLDLINQIMQQTQQESTVTQTKTSKSSSPTNSISSTTKQKTWSGQTNSCLKAAINSNKPVECNLCHRKFKNIPALNGHMRLHGGYFKKDSDSKKSDKKDIPGPPLQTASISVRALIEEKIIQKRTTGQSLQANDIDRTEGETPASSTRESSENESKLSSTPTDADKPASKEGEVCDFIPPMSPEVTSISIPVLRCADHPFLKRNPRPGVKRANSDPGLLQPFNDRSTQLQLSLPGESYSLGLCRDENGYLSPPIPDDVLDQVQSVQETMLLQGVDPTQLAESIQAATLHDIAALDDYHSPSSSPNAFQHRKDLQRVLDSPLPVGLADFAYTQDGSDAATPNNHTFVNTSPTFAYPTPPASQEGDSPPFPLLQSVISHSNVASPLSPGFYTSTVTSSAAVEAALSEVLPQHNYPSPPPQSPPAVVAPVTSPLSVPPSSPVSIAQSHMLPNSDDPLLSSNPRDFGFQRKADFQSFKLLPSGIIDFGNASSQGVTGIVLDRNGELKLVQTSFQSKTLSNKAAVYANTKAKFEPAFANDNGSKLIKTVTISTKSFFSSAPKTFMDSLEVKDDLEDVFLSPSVPASPVRVTRKRPRLDNHSSLTQPYHSRLRKPRRRKTNEKHLPYTPPPILPPTRQGTGLYWQNVKPWPSSTSKVTPSDDASPEMLSDVESGEDSDITPRTNVGSKYQCTAIPQCSSNKCEESDNPEDVLLWDANLCDVLPESKVDTFLDFACCAAVPGGGRNKEYALHILQMCKGNVHEALLKLMQPTPILPEGHPLLSFDYPESEKWTLAEIDAFQHALLKHDKDFSAIVQEVSTKTMKECIHFYYIWKKICPDEYKKLRCSFNSKAALNGHMRLHVSGTAKCTTPDKKNLVTPMIQPNLSDSLDEFPCKICGKVFNKVKSRSAHMKSHRPPDAEARKLKHEVQKGETAEQMANRSSPVSSSNSDRVKDKEQ